MKMKMSEFIPTTKEQRLISDCRNKIIKLYNHTKQSELKRRCAVALTALNLNIEFDNGENFNDED